MVFLTPWPWAPTGVKVPWSLKGAITRQVEQKPGGRGRGRGRGREWATLGVHPLSWLPSNNRLEKVPFVSVPHTSFDRLLLSNQDKGCTPSVAHSLPLPLGPALLNLWIFFLIGEGTKKLGGHRIFSWEIGGSQKKWRDYWMATNFNENFVQGNSPKMHIFCATRIGGYMILQHCSSGGGS